MLRDNQELTHDMSVRSDRLPHRSHAQSEDIAARVDFDNAGVPSAIVFDPWGIYAFIALEASRMVAVVDVWNHREILRFDAGRAPQGLAISPDGHTLFVHNFMDRSVTIHDITSLIGGLSTHPRRPNRASVATEKLPPQTLLGKQLFYDAKDNRLALQEYLSCAACHNDGGQDGRVWDFTGFGEGLRNTISLRGHGGNRQGPLHWTGNFDEVQDFENQIRNFAGGLGLVSGSSPHPPLGSPNAGLSPDLDALATYLQSLGTHGESPRRQNDGSLTPSAQAGELVFRAIDCTSCHGGPEFTRSATGNFPNIGTLKPSSGIALAATHRFGHPNPARRLEYRALPSRRLGSHPGTGRHRPPGRSIGAGDLADLVAYLECIDDQPATAPANSGPVAVNDTASTNEGTAPTLGVTDIVTPNDTDADGDTLVISAVSNPINGTAVLYPTARLPSPPPPTSTARPPSTIPFTTASAVLPPPPWQSR